MNWRTFIWALWVAAVTFVSAEKGLEFPVHDGKDRLVNLRCVFRYSKMGRKQSGEFRAGIRGSPRWDVFGVEKF